MAQHAMEAESLGGVMGYTKVVESCQRLRAYQPPVEDDDSRVTEDQWAEMTQELLTLERTLADTKTTLQKYYRAISASRIPGVKDHA